MQIGSSETRLVLICLERFADGTAWLIRAGVRAPFVTLEVDACEHEGYDGLAWFFEALADSWPGWNGQHAHTTPERDLELIARHDRHVRLSVALPSRGPAEWMFRSTLVLERGEELGAAARDVRALVGARPEQQHVASP